MYSSEIAKTGQMGCGCSASNACPKRGQDSLDALKRQVPFLRLRSPVPFSDRRWSVGVGGILDAKDHAQVAERPQLLLPGIDHLLHGSTSDSCVVPGECLQSYCVRRGVLIHDLRLAVLDR